MRRVSGSVPKRVLGSVLGLGLLGLALGLWLTRPSYVTAEEVAGLRGDAAAGEAVFWAAGCASCHAAPDSTGDDRLILSGGQAFPSDFGTFRAPNISPDPTHGIGGWSLAEFLTAVQNGISPEGRNYYPAFPYGAYRLADRQDLADLFAYLRTLPASDAPSQPHEVSFPFSIRRSVAAWNLLFLRDEFVVTGELDAAGERGRYLAEALAHCAECHTARNVLGGLIRGRWLRGAPNPTESGTIPSLTPDELRWSADEIANYLADGFTPEFDSAGGQMRSVILNLAQIPQADRLAIAAYLQSLPAAAP